MAEKVELNDEDLDKVTGGGNASPNAIPSSDRGHHIPKYEVEDYIGRYVYILYDNQERFYIKGKVLDSYEESNGCGTKRVHKIQTTGTNAWQYRVETVSDRDDRSCMHGTINMFYGDDVTVYFANVQEDYIPDN